jgi:proline iminopeptidase
MNTTVGEVRGWNHDFESASANCPEYLADYSPATLDLKMPVLFFYGKTDWMVGPQHYRCAGFPEMLLWPSNVGHVAIMENREDLEKAIGRYLELYSF